MHTKLPLGWCDLLIGLFLALLIVSAGISGIVHAQDVGNRAKCASNLHQLGLAILLYQGDNNQCYPRTVGDTAADPKPIWGTPYQADPKIGPQIKADPFDGGKAAPSPNDVTASLFLLVREEQITPAVYICPSTQLKAWDFGGGTNTALNWTNWDGNRGLRKHLCYSFQNPFVSPAAIDRGYQMKNPDATFAVMADMNPGTDAVTSVTLKSPLEEIHKANSLNHQGEGQNVLFGDGHAEWVESPFAGTQHDNIYSASGTEIKADERTKAVILASPASMTDSILLPTAADIGYKPRSAVEEKSLTVAERNALQKSLEGTYEAFVHGGQAVMTINDKIITYHCPAGLVAINYQPIGGRGTSLVVILTTLDKSQRQRATLEVEEGELSISALQDWQLDYGWKKTPANGPTTQTK